MRCSSVTSTSRIGVSRSPGVMLKRGTARISAWRYACQDRKSTRLNSSHSQISYAVFCLKKKTSELQLQSNLVCRLLLEKKKGKSRTLGQSHDETAALKLIAIYNYTIIILTCVVL